MSKIFLRGISLFVKVTGDGHPLVLMHGGPGVDHTTMLPFLLSQITLNWSFMTIDVLGVPKGLL